MQVVYDPKSRFDELAAELNGSSSSPVSNLTLFSPSKVCVCGLFAGHNHIVIVVYNTNAK